MARIAILISGFGSNQQAIQDAVEAGQLPDIEVALVVSNRCEAFGIRRAINHGVPVVYFPLAPYTQADRPREEYDADLACIIQAFNVEWVVMAGWMHVLSDAFLRHFPSRVINLHPALPGMFPGVHGIAEAYVAYKRGEIEHTGIMVHLVPDPAVDAGPVIAQEIVPIQPDDSLEDLETRIHAVEHRLLVEALRGSVGGNQPMPGGGMGFYSRLEESARRNNSLVCVGLDPRPARLGPNDDLFRFNQRIIDATRDLVCAYKPNFAFYESAGPEGLEALRRTIAYIHESTPVPVILDAKRGDIGATARAYAQAAFEVWGADAVTVNPYLGQDSVTPFTAYAGRGVFLLCHTSNPGATDLQTLNCPSRPLYEIVAEKAAVWDTGLVVGATYPEALARVRSLAPEAWILLPGIGAQGGGLEPALAAGLREDGLGVVINSSRGIIYASDPRQAALDLQQRINEARSELTMAPFDFHTRLILTLADIGAIKFGDFALASGKKSPIYIDLRLLASHPDALRQVTHAYASLLRERFCLDPPAAHLRLAAIPYAALPIGTAVALELGLPLIYPRKETKAHGTASLIEGEFQPGDRVVVLDDLITTGGSKLAAIEPLEAAGLVVDDVVVLIDRQQGGHEALKDAGLKLHSVLGLGEMAGVLFQAGRIDAGQRHDILALLKP